MQAISPDIIRTKRAPIVEGSPETNRKKIDAKWDLDAEVEVGIFLFILYSNVSVKEV